uniref:Uncharacterized protein n=1 Tax=Bombyx mori TaxID=7091 RepID=A0A8R2M8G7_BOMMO|nr:uncharacterized protein LOC101739122 isoform X1 [Bombyx mori]
MPRVFNNQVMYHFLFKYFLLQKKYVALMSILNQEISVSTHSNNNEMKIDKDNKYDEMISKNERFARHAEAITENVAEHILKEINRKYPKTDKRKRKLLSALKKKYGRQKEKTQKRKMTKNENRKKMTTRNSN